MRPLVLPTADRRIDLTRFTRSLGVVQACFEQMELPDGSLCAVVRVLKILQPIKFVPPEPSNQRAAVSETIVSWPERIKEGGLLTYRDQMASWGEVLMDPSGEKAWTPLRLLAEVADDVDLDSW